MAFETMHIHAEGPILWIVLDRPEAMNAYTAQMGAELASAFQQADADDAIRVVVLTAKGRVFFAQVPMSRQGLAALTPRAAKVPKFRRAHIGARQRLHFGHRQLPQAFHRRVQWVGGRCRADAAAVRYPDCF